MEWSIVAPRRGWKHGRAPSCIDRSAFAFRDDDAPDEAQCEALVELVMQSRGRLSASAFYSRFLSQLRRFGACDDEFQLKALLSSGKSSAINIFAYGIGSILNSEAARLQISLMLLLRRNVAALVDATIHVFDPILSPLECRALQRLGCSLLATNDQGRRRVATPTLFFMPHCDSCLYDNLLQANWGNHDDAGRNRDVHCDSSLHHVAILGNSFSTYRDIWSLRPGDPRRPHHVLESWSRGMEELAIGDYVDATYAFNDLSWHFFPQ